MGSWSGYERDRMFLNPEGAGGRFVDASYVTGLDFDDDGRASVPVDIDGDGDMDLATLSLQGLRLAENRSPAGAHFVRVRLEATKSQHHALGAVARVTAGGVTQQDHVRATEGFMSQVSTDLHFGLGASSRIDRITVRWPGGSEQTWTDLPADGLLTLREGVKTAAVSAIPRWPERAGHGNIAGAVGITLPRLDGGPAPLGTAGTPFVVSSWNPGDEACLKQLEELKACAAGAGGRAEVFGVLGGKPEVEAVRGAMARAGATFPQFLAEGSALESVQAPATLVFDAAGRLRREYSRLVTAAELAALLAWLEPEDTRVADLEMLARQHLLNRDYVRAITALDRVIQLKPSVGRHYYQKALALIGIGKDEEALTYFQKSIELDTALVASAHYNAGSTLRKLKRSDEAIDAYLKALEIMGEDSDTLVALAGAAAEAGQWGVARSYAMRAVQADPESVVCRLALGKIFLLERKPEEAKRCFEKALAIDPESVEARQYLELLSRQ